MPPCMRMDENVVQEIVKQKALKFDIQGFLRVRVAGSRIELPTLGL